MNKSCSECKEIKNVKYFFGEKILKIIEQTVKNVSLKNQRNITRNIKKFINLA